MATGGGTSTLEELTPAEDLAASTLCPEAIEGFGGVEVGGVASPDGKSNFPSKPALIIWGVEPWKSMVWRCVIAHVFPNLPPCLAACTSKYLTIRLGSC